MSKPVKTKRKPKFKVGDVVTTRFTAKVDHKGVRGRKYLYLLSGCKWTVKAVEESKDGRKAPVYTLTTTGFEIRRQEYRLKPIRVF